MSRFDKDYWGTDELYKDKFLCINYEFISRYLTGPDKQILTNLINKLPIDIQNKEYIVVNKDEKYAPEVWDIVKKHTTKQIIAFVGRAGSGKDYQCNKLVQDGFKKVAFADALRNIAFTCLGINPEWGMKHYDELKQNNIRDLSAIPSDCGEFECEFTFRDVLEKLGTEGIRKYDNDFWAKCLIKDLEREKYPRVCISDLRFPNEYVYLNHFAQANGYEFKCIFCDYHSDRYQADNEHASAQMSNWFVRNGYKDLQKLNFDDIERYVKYRNFLNQHEQNKLDLIQG